MQTANRQNLSFCTFLLISLRLVFLKTRSPVLKTGMDLNSRFLINENFWIPRLIEPLLIIMRKKNFIYFSVGRRRTDNTERKLKVGK